MDAESRAKVSLEFTAAAPGDLVVLQVEDGGRLGNGRILETRKVGLARTVEFEFKTSAQPGTHRVTANHNGDVKTLDFWVGPEPPVRGMAVSAR